MQRESKIKCSVPLLTLNSGKYLEKCLNSISDFNDIFLLDGNSTDNTLDIANKHNFKVYKQIETDEKNVRISDFSAMRIKASQLAKNDWILYLDSDEFITKELSDEILENLNIHRKERVVLEIQKKSIIGEKIIEYSFNFPNYNVRVFNKKYINWKKGKLVHEQLDIPKDVKHIRLKNCFYSYETPIFSEVIKKDNYYLSLVKKKLFASKPDTSKRKVYLKAAVKNFLRAGGVFIKSIKIYFLYGFKNSLPIKHVYRYARYYIIVSYFRFKLFLLTFKK